MKTNSYILTPTPIESQSKFHSPQNIHSNETVLQQNKKQNT